MRGVLKDVLPGEDARAAGIAGRHGKRRLLQEERGAPLAPHAVHHADERGRRDREEASGEAERSADRARGAREGKKEAPPPDRVAERLIVAARTPVEK